MSSGTQELHFLFEEPARRKREGFVVFCSECECVLRVSKGYSETSKVVESLMNRCPGCGGALELSVSARSMPVAEGWGDVEPTGYTPRKKVEIRPANELRGFRTGLPRLDCMIEPLEPGRLAVVRGRASGALVELLSFRAQLPASAGGLDSPAVFIDGGNCSDLYLFSRVAARAGVNPRRALRRVVTSRAFTVYQLADLVSRELPRVVEEYGARLVVVSDVLAMFEDPGITPTEAKRVIPVVCDGLRRAKGPETFVVVTLGRESAHAARVEALADILLELRPEGTGVRADLLRHPRRRSSSASLPGGVLAFGDGITVWRHGENRTIVQDGPGS